MNEWLIVNCISDWLLIDCDCDNWLSDCWLITMTDCLLTEYKYLSITCLIVDWLCGALVVCCLYECLIILSTGCTT